MFSSNYLGEKISSSFFLTPATDEEISEVIDNLNDSAAGWDDISTKVFQQIKSEITVPITFLCNLSFITGVIPRELKLAMVIPIYKAGDVHVFTNYRPISVLCVLSKIFERLVYNRLFSFISKHCILYKYQFGFHPKHSTEYAIICLVDKITIPRARS